MTEDIYKLSRLLKTKKISPVTNLSGWNDLFRNGILITKKTDETLEYDGYHVKSDITFEERLVNNEPIDESLDCCVFEGNVHIKSIRNNLTFENCEFFGCVNADNSFLGGKIRFRSCTFFGQVNFNNTKFSDLADFWRSTFKRSTIFYKTDFLGTTVFSAATFENNVLFTYSLIKELVIFRGTAFKKGLDLSTSLIQGTISTFDITLGDFTTKKRPLNDEIFESAVSSSAEIPRKNKRETYRIIKQAFISQNNVIESIKYQVLEKQTLLLEEFYNLIRFRRYEHGGQKEGIFWFIYGKMASFINCGVLLLNLSSNWFGRAPLQSAVFTILIGAFFFSLSMSETNQYDFSVHPNFSFIKSEFSSFSKFLLPTHSVNYLGENFEEVYRPTNWFYLWDWLGRIAVGFGFYQTIQAFRKFR